MNRSKNSSPALSERSVISSVEVIGSGTSIIEMSAGFLPGHALLMAGPASRKISSREIDNSAGPLTFRTATTTICDLSSSPVFSEPKGQPEPTIRSQVISSFFASAKTSFSILHHSPLSHSRDVFPRSSPSKRDGNATGLISTPPMPASFRRCNSLMSSSASTLFPFHHHLTKGWYPDEGFRNSSKRLLPPAMALSGPVRPAAPVSPAGTADPAGPAGPAKTASGRIVMHPAAAMALPEINLLLSIFSEWKFL